MMTEQSHKEGGMKMMIGKLIAVACAAGSMLFGVTQYDSDTFIGMVHGDDEIVFVGPVPNATIRILGSNLPKRIEAGLWIDVDREGKRDFRSLIGDDLLAGNEVIELGVDFRPGDELEMKFRGHELKVGALTSDGAYFPGIRWEGKWPDFNEEYGINQYFRNHFGRDDDYYIDWTIETASSPSVSGQPLPGTLATMLIGLAFSLIAASRAR